MKLTPFEPGGIYHFYNRGNNKENIFRSPDTYRYFLGLALKYLIPIAEVYSYCLLPNHFHFVIRIKEIDELNPEIDISKRWMSQPFSNMFNAYSKAFNKMYNRTGSLFQKHPKRLKVETDNYLRNLIIYVNTNSHIHNISDYKSYPFSSYSIIIKNSSTFVARREVIELFDDVDNFKSLVRLKLVNLSFK